MDIHDKIFKEELRRRFVDVLNSKRGLQSDLAKSIGKPSSYFSELKRGNPVNALHLKAVGIILGPEKVVELLDIDNNVVEKEKKFSDFKHPELVELFKQKKLAWEINHDLLQLEIIDPKELKEIHNFIKFRLDAQKNEQHKNATKTNPVDPELPNTEPRPIKN